jgi:hypothetical protein
MQLTITKTSLPKALTLWKVARTVKKPPRSFLANVIVRPAISSSIIKMMFCLCLKYKKRLKIKRTLTRKSQLPKNKSRKTIPPRLKKGITLTIKSNLPTNKSRKMIP